MFTVQQLSNNWKLALFQKFNFSDVSKCHNVTMSKCALFQNVHFSKTCTFPKPALFQNVHFSKTCTFPKPALFQNLHFSKTCIFPKPALFQNQHFSKTCTFQNVHFSKCATFCINRVLLRTNGHLLLNCHRDNISPNFSCHYSAKRYHEWLRENDLPPSWSGTTT